METQNAVCRAFLVSSIPSNRFPQNNLFSNLSQIRSPKWVSLRIHCSLSSHTLRATTKTQCVSSNEKVDGEGVSNVEEDNSERRLRRKNLAVFVSGGGSNFRSIHEATLDGSVHGNVVVLVTNKQDCGGAEYARGKGIPIILFPKRKDGQEAFPDKDLVITLRSYKVHKAVIASGARYSGPTIHYVDEQYDTGRILAQRVVHVLTEDTAEELAARVLHEEHKLYVDVAAALCEERITWREDGVPLIQSKENPDDYF
ncbi:hypothetical protein OROGR_012578 [Orobanche gracilis]